MGWKSIAILPPEDIQRLREIKASGTLEGDADLLRIVGYLATAIRVVAEGQEQVANALQDVADKAGVGR